MLTPFRFIGEEIEVVFDEPPALEKKPGCPDALDHGFVKFRRQDTRLEPVDGPEETRLDRIEDLPMLVTGRPDTSRPASVGVIALVHTSHIRSKNLSVD